MDTIYRQVAIDAVLSIGHIAKLADGDAVIRMSAVNYVLRNLPSAEPVRMKGKWVDARDGYDAHVKCTGCFKTYDWVSQAQYYNFCPNCGASMSEGEEDD